MKHPKVLLAGGLAAASFLAFSSFAGSQATDTTPTQLRVIWTVNPATSATISWSTEAAGDEHVVYFDTESKGGDPGEYGQSVTVTENGQYNSDEELPFFHHGRLTDLEPNTEYFFVVESDGEVSPEKSFVSAHDDDREFKLLYGGDSRSDRDDRQAMNARIAELIEQDESILALAHGGDYIAHANSWWQWSNWMDDHEAVSTEDGRILPIIPARGNHEGRGTIYNQVFGDPGGDAEINYYVSEFGPTRVITLDSEASQAGDQRDWLINELEASEDAKWVVAGYHRPAFPTVKSPAGAREHWVPLFEEFNVDLVLESDGHALKRTPPIRNDRIDYTGVVYVGEGGLGVRQRTPFADRWYLQSPGMSMSAHHVQVLTFGDDLIRYEAVMMDGLIADEVTVPQRAARLESAITVADAQASANTRVEIVFTRPFDLSSATDASQYEITDDIDVDFVRQGSEVQAILQIVNTLDVETLDDPVGLDARAARNIGKHREGEDGEFGTDDDNLFDSLEELDAISYVGKSALEKLGTYATANVEDQRNAITLHVDKLTPGKSYTVQVSGVVDVDGNEIPGGTTATFTVPDTRADEFNVNNGEESDAGGCSTTDSNPSWIGLFLLGLIALRRRHS